MSRLRELEKNQQNQENLANIEEDLLQKYLEQGS